MVYKDRITPRNRPPLRDGAAVLACTDRSACLPIGITLQ